MTLDQLAEQAADRLHMRLTPREVLVPELRQLVEVATQAQREQLEQAQRLSSLLQATLDDVSEQLAQVTRERDETLGYHAHAAAAYETAVAEIKALRGERDILLDDAVHLTQERDVLRAAVDVGAQLPFCGHVDCAGGQHPARNCFGCEELWARWREALDACAAPSS